MSHMKSDDMVNPQSFLLWIDGVGCFRVVRTNALTIGGISSQTTLNAQHLSLRSDLSKVHVTLERDQSGYTLHPHHNVSLKRQPLVETCQLGMKEQIQLGEHVLLDWSIPHPLSQTAVIHFKSDHHPLKRLDGVIWMDQFCELSRNNTAHIYSSQWSLTFYLFFSQEHLMIRLADDLQSGQLIKPGGIFSHDELQFRYEVP